MTRWLALVLLLALPAAAGAEAAQQRLAELGLDGGTARDVLSRWEAAHGDEATTALLAVFEEAADADAPLDLVADKVAEGLAKQVPIPRLLPALAQWSQELGTAAALARDLRLDFDAGDLSERETVLRVQLLRRMQPTQDWLTELRAGAAGSDVTVRAFLGIGEAVGRLTVLGVPPSAAAEHGRRWLQQGVSPREAGILVQAVERGAAAMPAAAAAREVTERALSGVPPDDVLAAMDDAAGGRAADADDGAAPALDVPGPPAETGPAALDGRDLPAARGLGIDAEDERGRQIDDAAAERDDDADRLNDGRDAGGGDTDGVDAGAPDGNDPAPELDDGRGAAPQDRDNEETEG